MTTAVAPPPYLHKHRNTTNRTTKRKLSLRQICWIILVVLFTGYFVLNITWVYSIIKSSNRDRDSSSIANDGRAHITNLINESKGESKSTRPNSSSSVDKHSFRNSGSLIQQNALRPKTDVFHVDIENKVKQNDEVMKDGDVSYDNNNNKKSNGDEVEVDASNDKDNHNSAAITSLVDPKNSDVPAYVVSLILCANQDNTVGFLDSAAILRHSVHKNSMHYPGSSSKYSYKMYAIVHKNCARYAPLLESVGYETIIRDTPIDRNKIKNDFYRKSVESENCCGSAEFIKMFAYKLTDHPVVVHFDLDKIVMQPFDDLFDAIIYDGKTSEGMAARKRLDLEWPEDPVPDRIDAFFTRDYTSSWPWKKIAGVQGGFVVIRPSVTAFEQYMEIVLEGNYEPGFNNDSGWGGLGFGGFQGAKAFQGIVAYFYDHFHPGTAVELDVCKWNQVAADIIWRGPRGPTSIGECRKYPRNDDHQSNYPRKINVPNVKNNGCDDCRITSIEQVKTIHYTACKKPWNCPTAREGPKQRHRIDPSLVDIDMCYKLHREWFQIRKEFEELHYSVTKNEGIIGKGTGDYKKEYYLGYCTGEGKYNPMVFPEDSFDISKLYPHMNDAILTTNKTEELIQGKAEVEKSDDSLTTKMKRKLGSLSTPPWPQLDSRTSKAIANGTIVGPQPGSHQSTIVSAYYNFESKHSTNEYRTWFIRLLRSSDPLIIFVEPKSEWYDFIVDKRTHAPTIVVSQPFNDLVMSTTFTESFWQEQRVIDLEAKVHRGTGVYKIWNEKLVFLHAAMELNPFDSTMFAWMDAGYFRSDALAPFQNEPIVRLNITAAGVPSTKVFFNHVRDDSLDTSTRGRVATAGNSFMGTPEAMYELYDKYYATLWDWIRKGIFVGSDQMVMAETCFRYSHVCHPFFPGRFKDWFSMSKILQRESFDLSQISRKFYFGSEPQGSTSPTPPTEPITSHKQIQTQ